MVRRSMWACACVALGGCAAMEPPDAGIDAAPIVDARVGRRRDIGIDTGIDPWAPRDAYTYDAPYPDLDCDDPAFWTAEADRYVFSGIAFSNCRPDIPTIATRADIRGWGWGDFCLRVHASTLPELPVGITQVTREGVTLGLASPAEVDLEMRMWAPREDGSWRIVSERGMHWIDPPPPFRLVVPDRHELGRDVVYVSGAHVVTSTHARSTSLAVERAHGPLLAVGTVGEQLVWVRDETPPVVEILDRRLSTIVEHRWDAPFDRTRVFVLPFGVISGDQLLQIDGLENVVLPDVMDEVIAEPTGANARSGDRGWVFDERGVPYVGPSGVADVVGGGFLGPDRRVVYSGGSYGEPIDPAIGEVLHLGHPYFGATYGVRGFVIRPGSGSQLGVRTRLLDPETDGEAVFAGPYSYIGRRPDGTFFTNWVVDPEAFCE